MEFLSIVETTRYQQCEQIIERGLNTFVDVGNALLEIRDNKLYRIEYKTFEDYCKERWNISRPRAYQLIEAATVVGNLSTMVDKQIPISERQTRPLTKLEPEEQREAWQQVIVRADEKPITAALVTEVIEEIKNNKPHVTNNSGENEWYTPEKFIEAARAAMGSIDTDPASSDLANKTVQAQTYYTIDDDGLTKTWGGNIWMNPPYAQPLITQFTELLSDKFDSGEINQACVLVNNATETNWFQRMLDSCTCLCLLKSRVKFIDKSGNPSGAPLQGQIVLYFGNNQQSFEKSFSQFGKVLYG
jgi:hypothetical protein